MLNLTSELKSKLLKAESAEEAAALLRPSGVDDALATQIWNELCAHRGDKELSLDELEAVSGGADRNWATQGCAATVEYGSWCDSNDYCSIWDVTYDNPPLGSKCPNCGTSLYRSYEIDYPYMREVAYKRCKNCGYKEFDYR